MPRIDGVSIALSEAVFFIEAAGGKHIREGIEEDERIALGGVCQRLAHEQMRRSLAPYLGNAVHLLQLADALPLGKAADADPSDYPPRLLLTDPVAGALGLVDLGEMGETLVVPGGAGAVPAVFQQAGTDYLLNDRIVPRLDKSYGKHTVTSQEIIAQNGNFCNSLNN